MKQNYLHTLRAQYNYWVRDTFWGGMDYLTHHALRCLSMEQVSAIGHHLGMLHGRYRFRELNEHMLRTVKVIKPDITETELGGFIDRVWSNMGRTLAEMSVADRAGMDRIRLHDGDRFFKYADPGIPFIFLFTHLGNWEMIARCAKLHGYTLHVVYEFLHNRFQRKIAKKARARIGYEQIHPDLDGIKEIYQLLENGEYVCLAMDEYKNNQVMAPAFGRNINGRTNIELAVFLAKKFQAIIMPVYCLRREQCYFDIYFSLPILPEHYCDESSEQQIVHSLNSLCEAWVKQYPDQWYMLHRLNLDK